MKKRKQQPYRAPSTVSRKELLINGSDDHFRKVLEDLVDFSDRLRKIRQALAQRIQLTPPQYTVLMTMAHSNKDAFSIGDMAAAMRVSVPFVVQETNRLEAKGLVSKSTDPEDRRRVILMLTDLSKGLLSDVSPIQVKVNDALFATISRSNLLKLGEIAAALLSSCDEGLNKATQKHIAQTFPRSRAKA
jgi:DNA-binding MarR family transcriptional regulator